MTADRPEVEASRGPREAPPAVVRAAATVVNFASNAAAVFAWLVLLAWFAGELASDRWFVTQWLEWIPTPIALIGALGLLAFAAAAAALWPPLARDRGERRPGRSVLRGAWVAWIAVLMVFVARETPFYRPRPAAAGIDEDPVRVVYWNAGGEEQRGWDTVVGGMDADVIILNGLEKGAGMPGMQAALAGDPSVILNERFCVISRLPVVRWGATALGISRGLGLDPRQDSGRRRWIDVGRAMFFEFEPGARGGPRRVAWVIDLPSDLSLPRHEITARARQVIDTFADTVYVKNSVGAWVPEQNLAATSAGGVPGPATPSPAGFPRPDFIIGDFNIPRGSASLNAVNLGYPDAFREAARRYTASWPRRWPFLHFRVAWPLFHLDLTFVAPRHRAVSYGLVDPGSAEHLAQVVDLALSRGELPQPGPETTPVGRR